MNLVKVGDKVINLDMVSDMDINPTTVRLYFGAIRVGDKLLEGRDAEVFKYWLSYRVSDADNDYQLYLAGKRWAERDTELYMAFHAYQEAGGELEAAEWIVAGEPVHD